MATTESNRQTDVTAAANRKLLFFNVGVLGSIPLEFPGLLTREFDGRFINRVQMKAVLLQLRMQREGINPESLRHNDKVLSEVKFPTKRNLVSSGAFNSFKARERQPLRVAHELGMVTVALDFHAPTEQILERVSDWAQSGLLHEPAKGWDRPPNESVIYDVATIVRPLAGEQDLVISLDGFESSEALIDQVAIQLAASGFSKPPQQ
jgi:hypothetical protein